VELVELPQAMTIREFASRYPSAVSIEILALLNHAGLDERLPVGLMVKRVMGEALPG